MSAVKEWLAHLDDEAIVAWSNRGLLRRGAKLLEGADEGAWRLDEAGGGAELDGQRQTLVGVGFNQLQCSCPALGPCHHLTALLQGLRQRAVAAAADAEASGTTEPSEPANVPLPWLLDKAEREQLFGKRLLRTALRWLVRGEVESCEAGPDGLRMRMSEPESAAVYIPRVGGIAGSVCDCRAPSPCAHRALAVLAVSQEAGLVAVEELVAVESLDEAARIAIDDARTWLLALLAQGGASVGEGFAAQGEALATALRQADLPLPASRMTRVAVVLETLRQRRSGDGAALRLALAPLWAGLTALTAQPLPRPLAELAGVHRRRYTRQDRLSVQGLALECWRTPSGHRGLTLHCYDLDNGRCYRVSESRPPAVDPAWQPETAASSFFPGGRSVEAWRSARWTLSSAWVAGDRLSLRDDTRIAEAGGPRALATLAVSDFSAAAQGWRAALSADPFVPAEPYAVLLRLARWEAPEFDRYRRRWRGQAYDDSDKGLAVEMEGGPEDRLPVHVLAAGAVVFGYLFGENGAMVLRLVASWDESGKASR